VHGGIRSRLCGCGKDSGPEVESAPLGWDEIEQLALGEMAMTWEEFMHLTPRVFTNKVKGFQKDSSKELQHILGADAMVGGNNHQPASEETTQAQGLSHLPLGENQEGSTKREADIHPNPKRSKEPWHH
jgi:hypothetical protein